MICLVSVLVIKMNLPNKLTVARLVMSVLIIALLLFPFHEVGIDFPQYMISSVVLDLKYVLAGILFILASLTDFLDGYIARKYNLITDPLDNTAGSPSIESLPSA